MFEHTNVLLQFILGWFLSIHTQTGNPRLAITGTQTPVLLSGVFGINSSRRSHMTAAPQRTQDFSPRTAGHHTGPRHPWIYRFTFFPQPCWELPKEICKQTQQTSSSSTLALPLKNGRTDEAFHSSQSKAPRVATESPGFGARRGGCCCFRPTCVDSLLLPKSDKT